MDSASTDTRYCYGARCTWWGSIYEIGKGKRIPVCPFCFMPLFEVDSYNTWMDSVEKYEKEHPGENYKAMMLWARNRQCYPNFGLLKEAFDRAMRES